MDSIVPRPLEVETEPGAFEIGPETTIRVDRGLEGITGVAELLAAELTARVPDLPPLKIEEADRDAGGGILLSGADAEPTLGEEGYELVVAEDQATLRAPTTEGVFRGTQSLLQAIATGGRSVPAGRVFDKPRYPWRGMHLDVGRHFFTVDFVKKFIDLLVLHKMNTFHWHLTEDQGWRIAIDKYPRLTEVSAWRTENGERYGGFYSKEEVRDVVEYARQRFIRVVPEIELPGHSVAVLAAYPEFACTDGPFEVETNWGIFDDVYCAGNDAALQFLEDVLDEVIELFPGEYVHIGGDECPKKRWKECAKCQARIRSEGLAGEDELQSWFVTRFSKFLADRGKRLVGWDEILEGGLAPNATVMSWRGMEGGIRAATMGHDVVMTPTSHCYLDYKQSKADEEPGVHLLPLETVYEFEPTPKELSGSEAKRVLGTQGNVWTERMSTPEQVEYMTLPRMCALAEVAWTAAERRGWEDFQGRLATHLGRLDARGFHYRSLEDSNRRIPY